MAARKNKTTHDDYRFYVYEITNAQGEVIYVGKGTGRRMFVSKRNVGGHDCQVVALFKRERDAYAFEVIRIAETSPSVNKVAGGNGPRCQVIRRNKSKEEKEIDRIGTRAYASRVVLEKAKTINHLRSKVEFPKDLLAVVDKIAVYHLQLNEVAYG